MTRKLDVDDVEVTIILLGLVLVHELLPKSGYHPELQKILLERTDALIKRIQNPPTPTQPTHDAYGNPY